MTETSSIPAFVAAHEEHACCQKPQGMHPRLQQFIVILEKIVLVALAVFAAYVDPLLFSAFFGFGFIMGVYLHYKSTKSGAKAADSTGCTQGFLEQLTGIRLPPLVGIAANVAIFACHIDHHPHIFIPLIGLNAGYKLGQMMVHYMPLMAQTMAHHLPLIYRRFCSITGSATVPAKVQAGSAARSSLTDV